MKKNNFFDIICPQLSLSCNNAIAKRGGKSTKNKLLILLVLMIGISLIFSVASLGSNQVANASDSKASVTFGGTTTDYTNITDAWNYANEQSSSANSRAEVKLLDDVNITAPLDVIAEKFITLDLNGFTLNRGRTSAASRGHVIESKGDFILTDTSPEQTGVMTGGYSNANGGGIRVLDSTFTLEGGAISGNRTSEYGGGIYTERATVYIKGGVISGNTSTKEGAGVEVYSRTTCIVTGGEISNNSADMNGGGINIYDSSSSVILAGGIITNNKSSANGSGVCHDRGGVLTVCGNAIVKDNFKSSNSNNIYMGSTLINVGCSDGEYPNNFTGEIGIYASTKYAQNAVFGTVAQDAIIAGEIANDRNVQLFGVKRSPDCVWDYPSVARIKETDSYYSSIASAYSALASSGQTIELLADATLASRTYWQKAFTITSAEGARYTISPENKNTADIFQYVSNGVTVTVENVIFDGLRDENDCTDSACAFYIKDNSTLNIEDGAVIQNFHISTDGVAVFINTGTLNMSGGEIKNNSITTQSGVIYGRYADAQINITGGVIKDNKIFNNANTGAVHLGNNSATLNIGGTAKIYDNYYQATTLEAKDVYLPSDFYFNQTSDFSGIAYVYAVNAYTENTKFGNNPSEYTGAKYFINSRDTTLVGTTSGEDLVWGDALPIIKVDRIAELEDCVGSLTESGYTIENWQAIQTILNNAIADIEASETIGAVENYFEDAKESIVKIDTIALAALKVAKIAELQGYVGSLTETDYTHDNWQEIQAILNNAIAEVQALTTIEAVENYTEDVKKSIDEVETIALTEARDAKIAALDSLLGEYNKSDYATADWDTLTAIINNAKDEVNGHTSLEQIEAFSLDSVQNACDAIAISINVAIILSTDTYYTNIADAWNDANALGLSENERAEVKLLSDIVLTATLEVSAEKYIGIDLNGFTLDRGLKSTTTNGCVIKNLGDLVIDDKSINGTGVIKGGYNSSNTNGVTFGGGVFSGKDSKLTMKGGSISENSSLYGGGVGLKEGATFIFEGGKIANNTIYHTSGEGGGIYAKDSTLEITGGEISQNTASNGGGVYVTGGSFSMAGGEISQNIASSSGGGIYLTTSSFTMTGGEISLNTATSYGGGIYQNNANELVLAGGEIKSNNCKNYQYGGGVYVKGNLTIAGDIRITDNVSGGTIVDGVLSGGSVNNIYLGAVLVNVGHSDYSDYDFTGEVGIYSNKYSQNAVFGTIVSDTDISGGIFTNDRNEYLFGVLDGTNLKWEYEFENTQIINYPTSVTSGLARQTAIGAPSVIRDIPLAALSTTDYDVVHDGLDDTEPKITYTLKDTTYGEITLSYDLPIGSDEGYLWEIDSQPTIASVGLMSATHNGYPGVSVSAELPVLNRDNYSITFDADNNQIVYRLRDDTYGAIIFNITDSLEEDKTNKLNDLFGEYVESNYSPDNWAIVMYTIGEIVEDVCWLNSFEDIESFTVDSAIFEQLSDIPTVEDKQSQVREQLEAYYKDYTGLQDIPEIIDEAIQGALELINAENCDNESAIDSIILGGKIEIAKQIKYLVLDDLLAEYNPKLYNETNWTKLTGYISSAKSTIAGYSNLAIIEDYNISTVRTNCNNVDTNMVARIGEDYYEKLSDAVNAAEDDDTVYVIKDIELKPTSSTAAVLLSGNKSITLRSDMSTVPEEKTAHVVSRGAIGTVIHVEAGSTLRLIDIAFDGKKISSGGSSTSHTFFSIYGTLIIEDNTEIYQCNTGSGQAAVYVSSNAEFIMNGGTIRDNEVPRGIAAINGHGSFYLNGGEIIDNYTPTTYDWGAANLLGAALINISGDIRIYNNNPKDLYAKSKLINVTGDFTGYITVYTDYYTEGAIFGTVAEGVIITGEIINARNTKLYGVKRGTDLIWDFEYDATRTVVTTKPTVTTLGVVTRYTVDNVAKPSNIPMLNTDDYDVVWDNLSGDNPQITYTLKDTFYGNIAINYDLPVKTDSGYNWVKSIIPSFENAGLISATHNDYPGVIVEAEIPNINPTDYSAFYNETDGVIYYQLKDSDYGIFAFAYDNELETAKINKRAELFGDYEREDYSEASWQEIVSKIEEVLADLYWLESVEDITNFTVSKDVYDELDKKSTIVRDQAIAELETYYKGVSGNEELPANIDSLIQDIASGITRANFKSSDEVDDIIYFGKIDVNKTYKLDVFNDYLANQEEVRELIYTPEEWIELQGIINDAKDALSALEVLIDVEEFDLDAIFSIAKNVSTITILYFSSNGNDNNEGTYDAPLKTLSKAISKVQSGGKAIIVMLGPDITTGAEVSIGDGKKITLMSSNTDIEVSYPTLSYTFKRSSGTSTFNMIKLTGGATLTLENITLNGNRSETSRYDGATIYATSSNVVINKNTILTKGNRNLGGSAIYLDGSSPSLIMNDGEISENYNYSGNSAAIGFPAAATNVSIILLGGKIYGNKSVNGSTKTGKAIAQDPSICSFVVGGDFQLYDNLTYNIVYDGSGSYGGQNGFIKVREDFTGKIQIDDNRAVLQGAIIEILLLDMDGNIISPSNIIGFPTINPVSNTNLHAHYNGTNWVWDYTYAEDYYVVEVPTYQSQGILARPAIIDGVANTTIYQQADMIELPILALTDYTFVSFDSEESKVYYTYNHDELGTVDIIINVDMSDSGFYYNIIELPTFEVIGELEQVNNKYPGAVFDDAEVPVLSTTDYNLEFTQDSEENQIVIFTLKENDIYQMPAQTVSKESFDDFFIAPVKANLQEALEEYISGISGDISYLQDAIEQIVNSIDETNFENSDLISDGQYALLTLEKSAKKEEIEETVKNTYNQNDYSTDKWNEILSIIVQIQEEIEATDDIVDASCYQISEEFGTSLDDVLTIDEEIEQAKSNLRNILEEYNEEFSDDLPEYIDNVIELQVDKVDIDSYSGENFDILVQEGKSGIYAYYLEEARQTMLDALDALLAEYNQKLYSEANWGILEGYITGAKATITGYTDLAAIENFNIELVRTNCNKVATNKEARIGEDYYEKLSDAISAAVDDDTVYVLKDAELKPTSSAAAILVSGNKSITLRSDMSTVPEGKMGHTLLRGANGTVIGIESGSSLYLADIVMDGNNYMTSTTSNFSHSYFVVNGTLTIEDNTKIHKCGSQSGYTVASVTGTFIMNGGSICDNKSNTAIPGIHGAGSFYLNGGEIIDNSPSGGYGTAYLTSSDSINISGNIIIKENKTNTSKNLQVNNKLINVTGDFYGEVMVYTNYYAEGAVFGTVAEGVTITGIIANERNSKLFGVKRGTDLIWDFEYDAARTVVTTKPTVAALGVVTRYTVDNVAKTSNIPMLNTDDYWVEWEDFDGESPKITYTLKDDFLGNIVIEYELPEKKDNSYNKLINIKPTATEEGEAYITNTNYPGFWATISIPALTQDDYTVMYDSVTDRIVYQLKDDTYGDILFNITDELEEQKTAKIQELLGGYTQSNYTAENWAEIADIVSVIEQNICWFAASEDIAAYAIAPATLDYLESFPTVADKQNEVREELEAYYKDYTESEDIPEIIENVIQSYLAQINGENCENDTAIEDITNNGKIGIAQQIKYSALDDLLAEYNQNLYNTTNWNKLVGYITTAKNTIAGYNNLTTIEDFDISAVRTSCDSVLATMITRIGDNYYESLDNAFSAAVDGDTIYLLKDIVLTSSPTLSGAKSVTLTSEGDATYTVTRGKAGSMFTLSNQAELTVKDIAFDGANVSTSNHRLFNISSATLNILDGTTITNCQTTTYAPVIYMSGGTLNMNGGSIFGNKSTTTATTGYSVIYASSGAVLNLYGGEITENTNGNSSNGIAYLATGVTVNVGGDMQIHSNTNSSGSKDLVMGALPLNVTEDFTGEIIVDTNSSAVNAVFGTVAEGVEITGDIINAKNSALFGVKRGANLIWDYKYDDSKTEVTVKPTVSSEGEVTRYTVGEVAITSSIPKLSTDDYEVVWDGFDDDNPQVTYTLKDTYLGTITIDYNLPEKDDSGYSWSISAIPYPNAEGELCASHDDYPGLQATVSLPVLTKDYYTATYDSATDTITYQLKEDTYGDILFNIAGDLQDAKIAKMQELFADYQQSNYNSDGWQEIQSIISSVEDDVYWLDNTEEIENYAFDAGIQAQLDSIPSISSVKSSVRAELEDYYKTQTGLQDIPDQVQDIIAQAVDAIDVDNYDNATAVDTIILDGKIAIAKEIKYAELDEYKQSLVQGHYTAENWGIIEGKIDDAISAIGLKDNLTEIENYDIQTVMDECDALHLVGFVARVGDSYFETFAEAYDAVDNGGAIYLIDDIALTPQETIITKSITIASEESECGKIYAISSADFTKQGALLKINNATVTIKNIEIDGEKTLNTTTGATSPDRVATARAIHVENGATLNIEDGTLIHNFHSVDSHGGAIYLTSATLNMSGGEISNNSIMGNGWHGAAIYSEKAGGGQSPIINLSGGLVEHNYIFGNASTGAVYSADSAAEINISGDIVFSDNCLYTLEDSEYIVSDRKDIVLTLDMYINLVGDFSGFVRVYNDSKNNAGDKIGNNTNEYSGVEYIVNSTAGLIGCQSGEDIVWQVFSKEDAKALLDAYVGDNPSAEIQSIVDKAKADIDNAEDNFYAISDILKSAYAEIDAMIGQQIANAKNTVRQELEQYYQDELEEIFGEQMADAILDIIDDKVDQVDEHNYNDTTAIEAIVGAGKQEIYAYCLQQAQADKKDELDTAIADLELDENDYTPDNWEAVLDIIDNAIIDIEALEDIIAVINYNIQDIKTSVDNIKTIAEELEDAKANKIDELEDYIADLDKDDYTPKNWETIQDILIGATADIEALETIGEVANYDIDGFKAEVDGVETIEQTIARELAEAKANKIVELEDYIADLDKDDYTTANWQEIQDILAYAIAEVGALETIGEVENYDVDGFKAEVNGIETIEQTTARELAEAKADKIAELEAYIATLDKDDYTPKNWETIQDILIGATADIEELEAISEVENYDVDAFKAEVNAVETIKQTIARELAEAKANKIAELDRYINESDEVHYTPENWTTIQSIISNAKAEIEALENIEAVESYDIDSFKADIDAVETKESDASELADAKAVKKAELESYVGEQYSAAVEDILANALADIDAATTLREINIIVTQAKYDIDNQRQQEDIAQAKYDLRAALTQYIKDVSIPNTHLTNIIDDVVDSVNKDNYGDLALIESSAKAELLMAEANYSTNLLDEYFDNLSAENKVWVEAIINAAKEDIGNEQDIAKIRDIVDGAMLTSEQSIAKAELNDDKEQAKVALENYIDDNFGGLLDDYAEKYIGLIDSAESIEAVLSLLDESVGTIKGLEDIADLGGDLFGKPLQSPYKELVSDALNDVVDISKEDTLLNGLNAVLDAYKENKKDGLDSWVATLDSPSNEVMAIINTAKAEIDNIYSTTDSAKDAIDSLVEGAIASANAKIALEDAKANKIAELDAYVAGLNDKDYTLENWQAIQNIIDDAKAAIIGKTDISSVNAFDTDSVIDNAKEVESKADTTARELASAKDAKKAELDAYVATLDKDDYTADSWQDILDIIANAKADIDSKTDISDVTIIDTGGIIDAVDGVETIEQTIVRELDALYAILLEKYNKYSVEDKYQYDDNSLDELDSIFDNIEAKKDAGDLTKQDIEQAINDLDSVKIKFTGSDIRPDKDDDITLAEYEAYGILESDATLDKGTKLVVEVKVQIVEVEVVQTYIDNEDLTHKFGELGSTQLKKELKGQEIYGLLDIYLVDTEGNRIEAEKGRKYKITILIPEELRSRTGIRIVYKTEDTLEVFDVTRDGNWLIFETDHLSNFYLIGDKVVEEAIDILNLWWLIILLAIIALIELAVIIWELNDCGKERKGGKSSANANALIPMLGAATIIIPDKAILTIIILAIIVVMEAIIIALLFIRAKREPKTMLPQEDSEKLIESERIQEEQAEKVNAEEEQAGKAPIEKEQAEKVQAEKATIEKVKTEVTSAITVTAEAKAKAFKPSRDIYNYSYKARLHLADSVTLERYIELKNHLLSYNGVSISESWGYERFMYRGKSVLKIRANVKSLNVFFNLNASDYEGTKYRLEDVSSTKIHTSTPSKYTVNGPRKLIYAKDLTDKYMSAHGGVKQPDFVPQKYNIPSLSVKELIEMELVKVDNINKTYEDIIYS